jgi:hypothetical protein
VAAMGKSYKGFPEAAEKIIRFLKNFLKSKKNKMITKKFFAVVLLIVCYCPVFSQKENSRKLIIVTFDGYRWKDVFRGADSALFFANEKGKRDSAELVNKYWDNDPVERRKKLMPFFWESFGTKGQVYGNRDLGSNVNVTNPYWFSYPGYNEIFTGYADTLINSNDYPPNPNITLQEFINKQPGYKNSVAAFTSWEAFTRILNKERSGLPINSGYMAMEGANLNETQKVLSQQQFLIPKPMGYHERLDATTYFLAKEYMQQNHPKVLQISFIETDAFGHQNKYDQYLESAHSCDEMLKDLWTYLQNDPFYKDQTTVFIATDHGRGNGPAWIHHNANVPGSDQIWFAVMGPYTPPLGEAKDQQLYQNQYAKTMCALLNINFTSPHKIGDVIETAIKKK